MYMTGKPFILFIEGANGVGKSSVTRALREQLGSTTLLDLSGCKDRSINGRYKTYMYHKKILQMMEDTHDTQMNYVISRSYMSEMVYCNLGYKPYSFEVHSTELINELRYLTKYYDVHFIVLTAEKNELEERLNRDKFCYNEFNVECSLEQQEEYKKELRRLSKLSNGEVRCFEVPNRNVEDTVEVIINSILTNMIG